MKFLLIIFMASSGNYNYAPTIVGVYKDLPSCHVALESYKGFELGRPTGICIPAPNGE